MAFTRPWLSRRDLLRGGVGLAACCLPGLGAVSAARAGSTALERRAKSVIYILLEGGMSHLDTWDLKPNAPSEIRGEYNPIATRNPNLLISEHLPKLAAEAHRYNVIRSVNSSARNHSPGLHWVLTGYDQPNASASGTDPNHQPSQGSIVAHEFGSEVPGGLPPFVTIPNRSQLGGRSWYTSAAHLGAAFDPFDSGPVPTTSKAPFEPPAGIVLPKDLPLGQMADRRDLLQHLDGLRRDLDPELSRFNTYRQGAFELLLGERGRQAFDLNAESAETRARYGEHNYGQGALLARRLVEAGVPYVLVNFSANNTWDTHRDNFKRLKSTLLPPMDQAVSTLLADLDERGLLDETIVLMMGEMGRTPIINNTAGRDHWPDVYSAMIAGGGLNRGVVLGASTNDGAKPADRPVHVGEVLATVYHQLGIDPHLFLPDPFGRPIPILPHATARPAWELIA